MRYSEITSDVLYHGTSFSALLHIVNDDDALPNGEDGTFSFTRSLPMAKIFARRQVDFVREAYHGAELDGVVDPFEVPFISETKVNSSGAVMLFERAGLAQRFQDRLTPRHPGEPVEWGDVAHDEQEEALSISNSERGMMQHCVRILLPRPAVFRQFQTLVLRHAPDYQPAFARIISAGGSGR